MTFPNSAMTVGRWDNPGDTVRLVWPAHGPTYLVAIRNAHPWVLRRPFLFEAEIQ